MPPISDCSIAIHEPVGPAPLLREVLQSTPPACCLLDLLEPQAGLGEMGLNAENDPRRRVAVRLVTAPLDFLEYAVVVGRVLAEVLLDRGKLGREQALAGEDERLRNPRDAAVAVAERMNGHDVQMRHRRADDDMGVQVAVLEPVDHLSHQAGDLVGVGRLVEQRAAWAGHADRARPPAAGALVPLEVAGVEVQIEDDSVVPAKTRIACHHPDVLHRTRVTGNCQAVVVVRPW